jgi:hypothetical protein
MEFYKDMSLSLTVVTDFLTAEALTILHHKSLDVHYVKHKLIKNTLPSQHHVKHGDTRVPHVVGEPGSKQ